MFLSPTMAQEKQQVRFIVMEEARFMTWQARENLGKYC